MALTLGRGRRRYRSLVEVYTRDDCGLCARAEELVADEARKADVRLIDIDRSEELQRRYGLRVPVVVVDGREVAEGQVQPGTVRAALRRARRGRWADGRRA